MFSGIPQRQGNTCSPWALFAPDLSHWRSQWSSACLPSCKAAPSHTCCKHADNAGRKPSQERGLRAGTRERASQVSGKARKWEQNHLNRKEMDIIEQVSIQERENPTLKLQETPQSPRAREKKRENERQCERN